MGEKRLEEACVKDERKTKKELIAEVSKSFQVESGDVGDYVMNVETGGGWTITIE